MRSSPSTAISSMRALSSNATRGAKLALLSLRRRRPLHLRASRHGPPHANGGIRRPSRTRRAAPARRRGTASRSVRPTRTTTTSATTSSRATASAAAAPAAAPAVTADAHRHLSVGPPRTRAPTTSSAAARARPRASRHIVLSHPRWRPDCTQSSVTPVHVSCTSRSAFNAAWRVVAAQPPAKLFQSRSVRCVTSSTIWAWLSVPLGALGARLDVCIRNRHRP